MMAVSDPLMTLRGVGKQYVSPAGTTLDVLHGIDLDVADGEAMAIVGPSGSGKSTLLNIMGTLDTPSAGSVHLDGENLLAVEDSRLAEIRRFKVGFVFQFHHLLPQCSVLENVLVPTLLLRNAEGAQDRACSLLKRVGLASRLEHRPAELSGGERQRVAVVRALINRPRILLADEPTGSLDRSGAESLSDLLMELNKEEDTALVVVTHSTRLAEHMHRVLELRDGILC